MHEVSLAGAIVRIVEQAAERERFRQVERLVLEVGALAGVEVEALRFALEAIAPGTLLEGARVEIIEPPGEALCVRCGEVVTLRSRGEACPGCGAYALTPTGGTELRVLDLIVHD